MNAYRLTLAPCSAFGSPLKGDTLFGQLCWAVRNRHGEKRLNDLLHGYTEGRPFAVVSDALPAGYLPRPALPGHYFSEIAGLDRKAAKKRAWLPLEKAASTPVAEWLNHCKTPAEIPGTSPEQHPQSHNTLNRETGSTGTGQFAPYTMSQYWYGASLLLRGQIGREPIWSGEARPQGSGQDSPETMGPGVRADKAIRLDLYIVLDETRLTADELKELLADIGTFGFGRDASIGLGKFAVEGLAAFDLPTQADADAWLTLAPCAPQGLGLDTRRSFFQPFTRFGRHGDVGVHLEGGPFKTPVLLAQTGAVLSPLPTSPRWVEGQKGPLFIGHGLGGDGSLSNTIQATVHQGYAPVVGIRLPSSPPSPKD